MWNKLIKNYMQGNVELINNIARKTPVIIKSSQEILRTQYWLWVMNCRNKETFIYLFYIFTFGTRGGLEEPCCCLAPRSTAIIRESFPYKSMGGATYLVPPCLCFYSYLLNRKWNLKMIYKLVWRLLLHNIIGINWSVCSVTLQSSCHTNPLFVLSGPKRCRCHSAAYTCRKLLRCPWGISAMKLEAPECNARMSAPALKSVQFALRKTNSRF
ncbi:hypothetical protein XELAEV_18012660mg [Xenopus laevis]|uniref:Uncharacterized protein n=1 Tax=Xenopus laevis TaxID=8355 RepID=A0A974DPY3_XENLA|nr:hypothetical protein XELAEV_18012660mg [Xenopus laevis]